MEFRVAFTARASADLKEIRDYIARDSRVAAERFAVRLVDSAKSLRQQPWRGSLFRNRLGIRKLLLSPYYIFYRIDESARTVEVLRFWHSSRDVKRLRLD